MEIFISLTSQMIRVDMDISTWSNVGLKVFDLIKQVQMWSRKINLTRKSNSCDTDRENKDLSNTLKTKFLSCILLEKH